MFYKLYTFIAYNVNIFVQCMEILQFDLKTRKTFLRRTKCDGIKAEDFYIGAIITIYSRNIKIIDFADKNTKSKLQTITQK